MISDRVFLVFLFAAVNLGLLAWYVAAKQEMESSELQQTIKKIASSANVNPNQSAQTLADEIIKRLEPLKEGLENTKKQVDKLANPPRVYDALYQDGAQVARVVGLAINDARTIISFQTVSSPRELDFNKEFEIQEYRVICSSKGATGFIGFGANQTFNYTDVTCKHLGPRK